MTVYLIKNRHINKKQQEIGAKAMLKEAIIREFSGQSRVLANSSNFKAKEMDLCSQIPN